MTTTQLVVTVILVMIATMLTRFLPFFLFPAEKETPAFIRYLGEVLPPAALGMLVIYAYKGVSVTTGNHGAPELIAGAVVILLQKWKKNMFLSIAGGTALYLILIHLVF